MKPPSLIMVLVTLSVAGCLETAELPPTPSPSVPATTVDAPQPSETAAPPPPPTTAPRIVLNASVERVADAYRLIATAYNDGNASYRYFGWCEPRGDWMESISGPGGIVVPRRHSCYHADPGPDGVTDGFFDHLRPGQTWTLVSWFNGTMEDDRGALVEVGEYNWTVAIGGQSRSFHVYVDWTADAVQTSWELPGVRLWGSVRHANGVHTLEGLVVNEGNRSYFPYNPQCSPGSLEDALWDHALTVSHYRDNCVPLEGQRFDPGESIAIRVEWNETVIDEAGRLQDAPSGLYTWELRFRARHVEDYGSPANIVRLEFKLHVPEP